jgi:parallel beta-helix repeat protein
MRIDWQSLAPNPWFQLCALVAVLSGGTTIYNFAQHPDPIGGGGGGTPPPGPPPISIATPTPAPVLKAKTHGHWIVDANGASDSDSRDLRAVAANLADGDTVTLRPGSYQGGFNVAKSVHFVGQGGNMGAVSIHSNAQDTITVSGKTVSLENLTLALDSPGDQIRTLHCVGTSHTELNHDIVESKARIDALVSDHASLDAHDSTFQTEGGGCGLKYEGNAHGALLRCAFSSNRWGLEALNAAQARATSCSFQSNGMPNGDGVVLAAAGAQARIDADQCQFTGNTSPVLATEGGAVAIANSSFKDNGITGEPGNFSNGVVTVKSSAKATLSNVTFDSNKQGIAVANGGSVTVSGCRISNTGIHTDNAAFQYLSNGISVGGQGSSAIVNSGTTISNSTNNGMFVAEGAQLTLDDATVEGSGLDGLWVGNNRGAATVAVRRGKFARNRYGLACGAGSSGNIQDCHFLGNNACGVWLFGANTKGTISNSEFRGHKGVGLWVQGLAEGQATGCTFDGNARAIQVGIAHKEEEAGTLTLENCTVTNNSICGIVALMKSTLTLRGMRFASNHNVNLSKDQETIVHDESKSAR